MRDEDEARRRRQPRTQYIPNRGRCGYLREIAECRCWTVRKKSPAKAIEIGEQSPRRPAKGDRQPPRMDLPRNRRKTRYRKAHQPRALRGRSAHDDRAAAQTRALLDMLVDGPGFWGSRQGVQGRPRTRIPRSARGRPAGAVHLQRAVDAASFRVWTVVTGPSINGDLDQATTRARGLPTGSRGTMSPGAPALDRERPRRRSSARVAWAPRSRRAPASGPPGRAHQGSASKRRDPLTSANLRLGRCPLRQKKYSNSGMGSGGPIQEGSRPDPRAREVRIERGFKFSSKPSGGSGRP